MSFLDLFRGFRGFEQWSTEEESALATIKERFPVGSVHTFMATYSNARELLFVVLEGAYLRRHQQLGAYGESVGFPATIVNVPYLDLNEGKRGSFCATSDIDKLSVRIA